jgi:deoxyribodipyrimidine photo-lyase
MKRSIVWFKTDLRLNDNETLVRAIENSDEVIPVYCFDQAQYASTDSGFHKTGSFRAKFLLESLNNLDKRLRKLQSGLIILQGKPEIEIPALAKQFGVTKVFAKKEVSHDEKMTEALLEKALWEQKCLFETFSTSTLYQAVDLPFSLKDIPEVFTAFRKKVELECSVRIVFEEPKALNSPHINEMKLPLLSELGLEESIIDNRSVLEFKGGETEGLKRLNYYLFESKAISNYKETRNGLIGSDYSTKFSTWLALGCLSPKTIYHSIKKFEKEHGANESSYWVVFELLWRDYFRFMLKKHSNKLFQLTGFNQNITNNLTGDYSLLQKWVNGETGNEFVDANMRELKQTGFMSNRGRQNVASYLIDYLKLDWRLGAAYFEQQLIDYDVSSNWGNWAYQAGVGNDPRGKRVFNIDKQAKEYDPHNEYRKLWLVK